MLINNQRLNQKILDRYDNDIEIRTWGGSFPCLEVISPGVHKAKPLNTCRVTLELNKKNILAFGDEDNDLEMIEYAGHGVAMKNGIDELKNIANAITPFTNDENGLAKYLQEYFNLTDTKKAHKKKR